MLSCNSCRTPPPPCNWQHTKNIEKHLYWFKFKKENDLKLNYVHKVLLGWTLNFNWEIRCCFLLLCLSPWWFVLGMLCLQWDEAGQKMLPGDGKDLIRLFLFINSNLFNFHIHRQGAEPQARGFGLGLSTEERTGLCQVLLAGWGAEHVEWLWLPWSSRIRSRWVRLLCWIVA